MPKLPNLSLTEYYPWRKTRKILPWQREHVNIDFLKHEKKHMKKVETWYHDTFSKARDGGSVNEIELYVLPSELSPQWQSAIAIYGNYNYFGLSAIQNAPSTLVLGLFSYDMKKQPKEYSLIRILKSKKITVTNERQNMVVKALVIEDWEEMKSDFLYVDVDYEKNVAQKILSRYFSIDKSLALSLQSPLISAPYVQRSVGGISVSSFANNTLFAQEFVRTLQLMAPPEYRAITPPERAFVGSSFSYLDGIKFQLAERPQNQNTYFNSFYDSAYSYLAHELENRKRFGGEYSIFSTLSTPLRTPREILKELAQNFTATEVTLPENIDSLKQHDLDLARVKQDMNEDLWIQIVHAHQLNPSVAESNTDYIGTTQKIAQDFDVVLSDLIKNEDERKSTVGWMLSRTQENLKRLAQSLARATNKIGVDKSDLEGARGIILDNFTGLIENNRFEETWTRLKRTKSDARFAVVQEAIRNLKNPTLREIYEAVSGSGLFSDLYDLQHLVDWMHTNGQIIMDIQKRYIWV